MEKEQAVGQTGSATLPERKPSLVNSDSSLMVNDAAELVRILQPEVNLCVWQRSVPVPLERFIDAVVSPRTDRRQVTCAARAADLTELLQDIPRGEGFEHFQADIHSLVHLYREVTGTDRITIKLEAFGGNLCEAFHADWVQLRLICCYAGPGTEWLDNADIDRAKLGPASGGLHDEDSGLLLPGARIRYMDRFSVGLMKGECWPGNRGNGLIHRSPKTDDATRRRVLLKIESERGK